MNYPELINQLRAVSFGSSSGWWYALFALLILLQAAWSFRSNRVTHSYVALHARVRGLSILSLAPRLFMTIFVSLLFVLVMQPRLPEHHQLETKNGRDFVLFVDVSTSMDERVESKLIHDRHLREKAVRLRKDTIKAEGGEASPNVEDMITRIDVAAASLNFFLNKVSSTTLGGDRFGLGRFSDAAFSPSPLTTDIKNIVLPLVDELPRYTNGGTEFAKEDGPIQMAIDRLNEEEDLADNKKKAKERTKVIVLITDGEATMAEERKVALKKQMGKVRFFVIGIGSGWTGNSSSTEPLRSFVKSVKGTVLPVENATQLQKGLQEINALTRSPLEIESKTSHKDFLEPFVLAAMAALTIYLLSALLVRERMF